MLIAKMENLLKAPPENRSSKPNKFPLLKLPFTRLCFSTKYIYKDISNDKNSSTLASTSLMVNIQLIGLHCSIYGLKGQKTKALG